MGNKAIASETAKSTTTRSFTNLEIARMLRQIAAAYEILGENRFRVLAYSRAAEAIEHATSEAKDLWDDGKLENISGIGKNIAGHLDELFRTGKVKHFNEVLAKMPPGMFPLLDLPGFGAKKANKLSEILGIKNPQTAVEDLKQAAKNHKIAEIPGFGAKSEEDILRGIELFEKGQVKENRMNLAFANTMADDLINYLREKAPGKILEIEKLGSLRRQVSTIGDIDIAVATKDPDRLLDIFLDYPRKRELIERGPAGASLLLTSGRQVDLRVARPDDWGSMLQYFTGGKQHNIHLREWARQKGLSLSEYGIKSLKTEKITKFRTEEEFYRYLDMDWIPPELREDRGEIEAAIKHRLPKLVELTDIKGDLQMHSSYNVEPSHDLGVDSMEEMLKVADGLGYSYIAFTEHNPSVSQHSPEQILSILKKRRDHIEQLKKSTKSVRIINLLEVDISPEGKLNIPDGAEEYLDGCLASIHSVFDMSREKMTDRVLAGLSNPMARIFAHPTGRLLGQREGYELNWEKVFVFCKANDKALEINAHPSRLDLPDALVTEAVRQGIKLSLGTDSHNKEDLSMMRYGVSVARRGWATKKDIINTWEYERIIEWFRKRTGGE